MSKVAIKRVKVAALPRFETEEVTPQRCSAKHFGTTKERVNKEHGFLFKGTISENGVIPSFWISEEKINWLCESVKVLRTAEGKAAKIGEQGFLDTANFLFGLQEGLPVAQEVASSSKEEEEED